MNANSGGRFDPKITLVRATDGRGRPFVYESHLDACDEETVARDIALGHYTVGPIDSIITVDVASEKIADVTGDIAGRVALISLTEQFELDPVTKGLLARFGLSGYREAYPEDAEFFRALRRGQAA